MHIREKYIKPLSNFILTLDIMKKNVVEILTVTDHNYPPRFYIING